MTQASVRSELWRLRPFDEGDADLLLRWRNSDAVRRMMFRSALIPPDEHRAWFDRARSGAIGVHQILEYKKRPVGSNDFTSISPEHGTAVWGCYIGEPMAVPPGAGAMLGYLALTHAFEILRLRKLRSKVMAFNENAISWNRSLGLVEEGVFKDHVVRDGQLSDVVHFAMLAIDWPKNKTRVKNALRL